MIVQGRWLEDSALLQLPNVDDGVVLSLQRRSPPITLLPELMHIARNQVDVTQLLSKSSMNAYDLCVRPPVL